MTRVFTFLIALFAALTLTACGAAPTAPTTPVATTAQLTVHTDEQAFVEYQVTGSPALYGGITGVDSASQTEITFTLPVNVPVVVSAHNTDGDATETVTLTGPQTITFTLRK